MLLLSILALAEAVPVQLTQQGRLLNGDQSPISGVHQLHVRLYNDPFAGTLIWEEGLSVEFVNGYYSVILGGDTLNNPLNEETLALYPLYLSLEVEEEGELSPRQGIYSTPYAQIAGTAEGVSGGVVNATRVEIAGSVVIDASGAWVGPIVALNWSDVVGIPADIQDGDDVLSAADVRGIVTDQPLSLASGTSIAGDLIVTQSSDQDSLADLSCVSGDVAKFDASMGWYCDLDAQLSDADVRGIVTDQPLSLAAGSSIQGATLLSDKSCQEGEVLSYQSGVWACKNMIELLDADADGVLAWGDCDDGDASLGALATDGDCDGALTADDCDDTDSSDASLSGDCDEDGVQQELDCDDADSSTGSILADEDCDGVLTADDCDDSDPLVALSSGASELCAASSCLEIMNNGASTGSGSYHLRAANSSIYQAYCEMSIDGGGWTLVLKAWNGDAQNFYNSSSHSLFTNETILQESSTDLSAGDHKSAAYVEVEGTEMLAIDLNDNSHYVYGAVNNGTQSTRDHVLDGQDGRWEGGANGCGIMLDALTLSQGSSTRIGSISVEHFGLMCSDDEISTGWQDHSDDSVFFGFLPRAANGDQSRSHHSGIGKWHNDGGDDVYESSNTVHSSSSGIGILIR